MNPNDEFRARIEELMGWKPGESIAFSLPTLRDLVRGKDPKFDHELSYYIDTGQHLFGRWTHAQNGETTDE